MTNRPRSACPEIRAATPAEIEAFYGRPVPWKMQAYIAVLNGQTIAVGGIYYEDGREIAFSDLKPEMRRHRRTIVEGARLFLKLFGSRTVTVKANPDEPGAERFLSRLGFELYDDLPDGRSFIRRAEAKQT